MNTSGKIDKTLYLSRNLNSALSPTAGKPKLRHIREDLSVNNRTHLFFVVFYIPRKYDIMFEKVADQGPHTVCSKTPSAYASMKSFILKEGKK